MFLDPEFLLSSLRLATPMILVAMAGILSERSGVANIALEAYLLASSFAAAATMAITHSLSLSVLSAVLAVIIVAVLLWVFGVLFRADQIVVGMAINLFAMGIIPVFSKSLFSVSGQTPTLRLSERILSFWPFLALTIVAVLACEFVLNKTVFGLRLRAAGENPQALTCQGVSVNATRLKALILGSVIAAIGGVYMSLGAGSGYTRNMSAGRGFMALAALIFGRWKPIPTFLTCFLFGFVDAIQMVLQSVPIFSDDRPFPSHLIQALPYIVTLLAIAGVAGSLRPPKSINR